MNTLSSLTDLEYALNVAHADIDTTLARAELAALRDKAAKWDKMQSDIEAGVVVLEMPASDEEG